jgi:type III secretion protein R
VKGAELAAWLAALIALPFLVVLLSGFIKFSVVIAILRRALGGGVIPPFGVSAALALLFALFVTAPVGEAVWAQAGPALARGDTASLLQAGARSAEPVVTWLEKHTPARERQSFLELQRQLRAPAGRAAVGERDLIVLAPAFVTAELKSAFQVGFLLFLPFLLLDLVCAAVLHAVGMHGVSAQTVALPLKLLLFVLADGWHLLFRGLVSSYT